MKSILLIFLFLIFYTEIHSQDRIKSKCDNCAVLTGRVIDADTKEPLIGVKVELLSTGIATSTNVEGNYIIYDIKPGSYDIQCSYIAYTTTKIENILLKPGEKRTVDIDLPDYSLEFSLQADEDIKNGDIKILIGGLPVFCAPFDEVNDVCEEFGFRYELMGCTFLWTDKYNEKIYKYLDEINGKGWRERFDKRMDELCEKYSNED